MQKVLRKRVLRDLKANWHRYLALSLLIIFSMYIVVSLVGAAEIITKGSVIVDEENKVQDGQFSVFVPLTEAEKSKLTNQGITLEEAFYLDFLLEDESTLRLYKNREQVDLIALDDGSLAKADDEVVLEKRYCEENDIRIGDSITFGGRTFQVSGIGTTPDYNSMLKSVSDTGVDSVNFGLAFVTEEVYQAMLDSGKSVKSEEYYYAYRLNGKLTNDELEKQLKKLTFAADDVEDEFFKEYWDRTMGRKDDLVDGIDELEDGTKKLDEAIQKLNDNGEAFDMLVPFAPSLAGLSDELQEMADGSEELSEGMEELRDETDNLIDEFLDEDTSNLLTFMKAEDSPRIQAASKDQEMYKSAGMIAGAIVLCLFAYVISVFVVHGIDQDSSVIGALYALGVKRRDLMTHYVMLPVTVTFLSGVIGTLLGYSEWGVRPQMADCYGYYSLPELDTFFTPYLLVYGIVVPPVIAIAVNCLVIRKRLSKPALQLIRNEQKAGRVRDINLGNMGFLPRFRIRQMLREMRSGLTVVFGMFISLLVAVFALQVYDYCSKIKEQYVADTRYEYMYTYKYPTKEVPAGGEEAFATTLTKEYGGVGYSYQFDVTVLGIHEDNPFFDVELEDSSSKVVISSSLAYKYDLKPGDEFTLRDDENDKVYGFTVKDIVQYSPSFFVFMDIDCARELFGESEDYYNVVFSDKQLEIESGRLYSTLTREDVKKSSGIFVDQMKGMVYMLAVTAAVIFVVVMYLMMKVMIERSSFHIALIKIFGFRNREVKKMYLDGNFYIVAIGALICIPIAKACITAIYPMMVSNVASGMDFAFSFGMYVMVYVCIILLYFVINHMLIGKIYKMVPAEVLKNRE